MKSITINDIKYNVGDTVYLVVNGEPTIKNVDNFKKCEITSITNAGYIHVKVLFPLVMYMPYDVKVNKDGTSGKFTIMPYSDDFEQKLNALRQNKTYIQNTFRRLKLVTKLSYEKAQKLNALLDEFGVDK